MTFNAWHGATTGATHACIPGRLRFAWLVVAMLMLVACENADQSTAYQPEFSASADSAGHVYVFGVRPQRNPKKLRSIFGPLVNYLNSHIQDASFVFEASRNFAAFDQKLAERQFDFVLPNPYGTLNGIDNGYTVFGKMGNDNALLGLIIVRRDSPIKTVADLKGKTLAFPGPTAFAATLLPKYFLHKQGLNVNADFKSLYVGSVESSLMNVYQKNAAAGTSYPPAWRDLQQDEPQVASELKVMWQTEGMSDVALMARNDIPKELVARVAKVLFDMQNNKQGRELLEHMDLNMFTPASNPDYETVRTFIKKYEAAIGPIEQSGKK